MLSLWQNETRVRSWNPWILKDEVRQQHLHSQPSAVFVVRSQFTACERGALRFHKSSSPTGSHLLVQKTVRIIMETCKENMKRNHLGVYSALLEGGNDSGCLLESNKKLLTGTAPFSTVWCYFLIYIFKQTWYYFVLFFFLFRIRCEVWHHCCGRWTSWLLYIWHYNHKKKASLHQTENKRIIKTRMEACRQSRILSSNLHQLITLLPATCEQIVTWLGLDFPQQSKRCDFAHVLACLLSAPLFALLTSC